MRVFDDRRKIPYLFISLAVVIFVFLAVYPVLYLFYLAFMKPGFPYLTGANFIGVLRTVNLVAHIKVTTFYVVGSTLGIVIAGFLIAYLINAVGKGKTFFHMFFILPLAIAPIVVAKTWRMALDPTRGVLDYILSLMGLPAPVWLGNGTLALISLIIVTIWRWTPLAVLILYAGFQTLPKSLKEAAAIDGANGWKILRHITLPLLRPFIIVTVFLVFVMCFKEFGITYGLAGGGPAASTETFVLSIYLESFQWYKFGNGAVLSLMLLVAGLLISRYGYSLLGKEQAKYGEER